MGIISAHTSHPPNGEICMDNPIYLQITQPDSSTVPLDLCTNTIHVSPHENWQLFLYVMSILW
jgi:hypothetical protein